MYNNYLLQHKLPRLTSEEIHNQDRPIFIKEIHFPLKNLSPLKKKKALQALMDALMDTVKHVRSK